MREILFRGKRKDNGEWVYWNAFGDICTIKGKRTRMIRAKKHGETFYYNAQQIRDFILCNTIGQYTGLTDKNGTKIFEGDVVTAKDEVLGSPFCDGITGKIVYDETAYFIEPKNPMETQWLFNECAVYEVIGNIHDNPELMEVQE